MPRSPARARSSRSISGNPCWIFAGAELDRVRALGAHVGQVPFNFQIGADVHKIAFEAPSTPEGELVVHLDRCDGEVIARLPRAGRHDLCLKFAQPGLDPLWVLDLIELVAERP